mgnify:CR=1 FL=1
MRLVSVGFNKPDIAKYLWLYIYDEDIHPARAYSPNLKSSNNVPEGCSALQFEVYESIYKKVNLSDDLLCEHIEKCINKMKIANKEDILFVKVNHEKYANVVFYDDINLNKKIVHNYLLSQDISCIGRFGEWDYLWSDESTTSAKKVIKSMYR